MLRTLFGVLIPSLMYMHPWTSKYYMVGNSNFKYSVDPKP